MTVRELEERVVKEKEVAFLWFNDYSGLSLKTPTKVLVVDPVDISPDAFTKVDAILVTHEHYDHLDTGIVKQIQTRTNCTVIADPTSTEALANFIPPDKLIKVKKGESASVGDVRVNAEESHHPPAISPVSFIITTEGGLKVFHTSDSLHFPGLRELGERYKPDLAFCTVGIAPGASPRTGIEIAKLVKPRTAVPYHGPENALDEFANQLPREAPDIKCMRIKKGKVYTYPQL
jgi:L-ascorbate metabolism protein UlaG (beta-lactamase superfamily)